MLGKILDDYLAGIQLLRAATADLTTEQLLARPIPGKWSTLEVVCHLADMEGVHADRMKRVVAEYEPTLLNADEDAWAAALAYQDRDVMEELAYVEATRRQMARILRALPESAFSRGGTHTVAGPKTLEQILVGTSQHLRHHVAFIHEKRRALGR